MTKAQNEVKEYKEEQRKPNFFEKKRFVDYDRDQVDDDDSDEVKDLTQAKPTTTEVKPIT